MIQLYENKIDHSYFIFINENQTMLTKSKKSLKPKDLEKSHNILHVMKSGSFGASIISSNTISLKIKAKIENNKIEMIDLIIAI